jgi:glycosidase
MHIILDFVPNHTSDQHMWFIESCKNDGPNNPYRDYYVWYPSEIRSKPPNNWVKNLKNFKFIIFSWETFKYRL